MPYIKKTVTTKHGIFVTKTKCFYYNISNSKKRRSVRLAPTPEGKKKRNQRQAYLRRKYLIYNNFDIGDMWVTLTYRADKTPDNPNEAHKTIMNVFSKLQKKLKRKGIPLMHITKTEAGENTRVHHHILIKNNFQVVSMLYDYWKEYGRIRDFREIYNIENGSLVKYILDGGDHKELNYEKFSHSRNLIEPKIETRIYPSNSFRENPKPPKPDIEGNEYIIRNLKNFFPDHDGYIYQEYEIVRVQKE